MGLLGDFIPQGGQMAGLLDYFQGMQSADNPFRIAREDQQRNALLKQQMEQAQQDRDYQQRQRQRQETLQGLPGQFMNQGRPAIATPGFVPGDQAKAGMDRPSLNEGQQGGFDYEGYANALAQFDPIAALQLRQSMRKEAPAPVKLGAGDVLFDPVTKQPIYTAPKEADTPSNVREYEYARQQGYRGSYEEWVRQKAQAGATQVNTYGSPVPVTLPDGSTGLVQTGNRGGPAQMVTLPGGASVKPAQDSKPPTEFEAKAGLYYKSMNQATQTINELERGNGWRPGLAEAVTPDGAMRTGVTSESRQKYTQAQKQWIDSINRVRSGANLPELEYNRAVQTFFPIYGEGEAIRQQKAAARAQEEAAMREAAGRAIKSPAQPAGLPSMDAIQAEIARRRGGR